MRSDYCEVLMIDDNKMLKNHRKIKSLAALRVTNHTLKILSLLTSCGLTSHLGEVQVYSRMQ